ncbi:MAG: iron-containing alcohol dehydrogenase [Anaerolineae bacterium]|nr:iron-containing alcohol dehydrogenase [Anaerolineae bacterium]
MSVWPLPRITIRELNTVQENRPVALLTSDDVWAVLNTQLKLPVVIQAEPPTYQGALFDTLAAGLPSRIQVIYAVGSGPQIDAAKIIAARNDLPLVIVPTQLDSVAMLTPRACVEEPSGNRVRRRYEETGPASEIIIDWSVISAAPEQTRAAGIVDVLSIITALLDWRHAAKQGKNPRTERFVPWAAGVAADLVKEAIKNAAAIGQGEADALETLLNLMMVAVQTANQIGHQRAIQGSEHYLADMLVANTPFNNRTQPTHAELIGPCMLFVSALHGQSPTALQDALQKANIRLDQINALDFNLMVDKIAEFVALFGVPYSILNEIEPGAPRVEKALAAANLNIPAETWQLPGQNGEQDTQPYSDTPQEAPVEQKDVNPS